MPSLQSSRAGTERDRLVLPGRIERGEIGRIGIRLLQQAGDVFVLRLRRRDRDERAERCLVGRLALAQPLGQRREDVRGLAEGLARLGERPGRKKFEEQRQEVRQLGGAHEQVVLLVQRLEVDHRLAAVAALAVHVLEQMQRQRARAVEQQHVALLQVVEIADGDVVDQEHRAVCGQPAGTRFSSRCTAVRSSSAAPCSSLRRIAQQRRQHLEGLGHHAISIGFLARFGLPNRLVSVVPPEQPLPNEKPHEPRRS